MAEEFLVDVGRSLVTNTANSHTPKRRRDAAKTREAILRAAEVCFAATGYAATGTREIAAKAGADPALIRRYFGSKENLFREALNRSFDMGPIIIADRATWGRHVTKLFSSFDKPPESLSIIFRSSSDSVARHISQTLFNTRVMRPLIEWVGEPTDRAALRLMTLWTGYFVTREVGMMDGSEGNAEELCEWVGQMSQAIIDGV